MVGCNLSQNQLHQEEYLKKAPGADLAEASGLAV